MGDTIQALSCSFLLLILTTFEGETVPFSESSTASVSNRDCRPPVRVWLANRESEREDDRLHSVATAKG